MPEPSGNGAEEVIATVSADHPCLPGHFPGQPIVPAVVILDEVRAAVQAAFPDSALVAIDHAKFQGFVLPDRPFRISLKTAGGSIVDFVCVDAETERSLATGRLRLGPLEPA